MEAYQTSRKSIRIPATLSLIHFILCCSECREQDVAPQAKDEVTTKWLWAVSEKWTRLYSPDKTPEFVTT